MTRRGVLQRSLITVLALLMVTPQVLLRPCCCAREKTDVVAHQTNSSLPPCCQKRLELAQKTVASNSHKQGIHDSGRCGCRIKMEVARTSRAIFKALAERQIESWMSAQGVTSDRQSVLDPVLLPAACLAPPDWGAEQPERLCRWLV